MEQLASIPGPGWPGAVAWATVALAAVARALGDRRAAAWVAVGAVGLTVGAIPVAQPAVNGVGDAVVLVLTRSGWLAHTALAASMAVGFAVLEVRSRPGPSRLAAAAAVGVALGLSWALTGPSWPVLLGSLVTAGLLTSWPRDAGHHLAWSLIPAAAAWLAADLAAQAVCYRPWLSGNLAPASEALVASSWRAVTGVRVAAPGALVAIAAAAWLAPPIRARGPDLRPPLLALGLGLAVGAGLMGTLRGQADSVTLLGGDETAPVQPLAGPARARCVVALGAPAATVDRFRDGCAADGARAVRASGDDPASALLLHGPELEVLVRRRPVPTIRPLRQLAVGGVPFLVASEPAPVRFDIDQGVTTQLDGWLDGQLGRVPELAPGHLWMVDTPRGTLLLLHGTGVSVRDAAPRREMLRRLLQGADRPALALVMGERWTVADVAELCAEARHLHGATLRCVLVPRPDAPSLRERTAPHTPAG